MQLKHIEFLQYIIQILHKKEPYKTNNTFFTAKYKFLLLIPVYQENLYKFFKNIYQLTKTIKTLQLINMHNQFSTHFSAYINKLKLNHKIIPFIFLFGNTKEIYYIKKVCTDFSIPTMHLTDKNSLYYLLILLRKYEKISKKGI
jgi:hypothetical protein